MELTDAIKERHSVRRYEEREIEPEKAQELHSLIQVCNEESGLAMQLVLNEPEAFRGMMARYGKFKNVRNYIALVGKKAYDFEEKCGYYGEKLVLLAQQLGLNTCWVGISYRKGKCKIRIAEDEKLLLVIALGYGSTQGTAHISKPFLTLCRSFDEMPVWFKQGVVAASLAPTAINQQKFTFELDGNRVKATAGIGFYSKVDLGIAKYHFEIGAGGEGDWEWA